MNRRRRASAALLALCLAGCGMAVRSDRAAIGGGPAQATAQAQARVQATVVAIATANSVRSDAGQACDCEGR